MITIQSHIANLSLDAAMDWASGHVDEVMADALYADVLAADQHNDENMYDARQAAGQAARARLSVSLDERIAAALRGENSDVAIFRAPDGGYTYRATTLSCGEQSGALTLIGWASLDGSTPDTGGFALDAYFSPDGVFLGPDQDGVYPVMILE